ncbi:MAG: redoxin domain-containing protein [Acidimicrobiales bacterium]
MLGRGGWIGAVDTFGLASVSGKIVVLDFFRASSINCIRVEAELRAIKVRFPDVVVIGIHAPKFPREHEHASLERAVERLGITHPVLDDPDLSTWQQYGVKGWPTLVLIDPEGFIVGGISGEGSGPILTSSIEQLIAEHEQRETLNHAPVIGTWSTAGATSAFRPMAFPAKVAVDSTGRRMAVADTGNDRVIVADVKGRVEEVHPLLTRPHGVAFEGDRLIVCDTGADRVVAIDRASGHQTVLSDQLASPWDVTVMPDRSLVVAEAGRHRLWHFPVDGEPTLIGSGEGQPMGVAALVDGRVAFVEADASALRVTTIAGEVTTLVGQGPWDWGASDGTADTAALQYPLGVAVDEAGALFVADAFNDMIRAWDGSTLRTLPVGGLSEPGGIAALPDGRLLVADTNNHRVVLVTPDSPDAEIIVLDESWLGTTPGDAVVGDAGGVVAVPFAVDPGGLALDTTVGSPVRVEVSAEPATMLASGPRSWALDTAVGSVDVSVTTPGAGVLVVSVEANVCDEEQSTIVRSRSRHDITIRP